MWFVEQEEQKGDLVEVDRDREGEESEGREKSGRVAKSREQRTENREQQKSRSISVF